MRVKTLDNRIALKLVEDFVTPLEIKDLLNAAHEKGYTNSSVVLKDGPGIHPGRTSSSCMFSRSENDIIKTIENRILTCRLIEDAVLEDMEGFQLVRYETAQKFDPHFDFFDNIDAAEEIVLRGQRQVTILVYLIDPVTGGATCFPELNIEVKPKMGSALMWNNTVLVNGIEGNPLALHGGLPVTSGNKIAMNIWIRGNSHVKCDNVY